MRAGEALKREFCGHMHMSVPPYLRVGGTILTKMVLGMGEMLSGVSHKTDFQRTDSQ